MRRWLPLLAVGLVLVAVAIVWYRSRPPDQPIVGQVAPAFQLRSLTGATVSLSQFRGRPVLVNFWATWCTPCKKEMPALQAAAADHPKLTVLGIDNVEPAVKVRPFVEKLGIRFPVLLDQSGSVVDRYRIIGMPTSFFIDPGGVLRAVYQGALTPAALSKDLAAIGA